MNPILIPLVVGLLLVPRQDDKPVPPLPPVPGGAAPLTDVDGKELVRGQLPASTTTAARERWQAILDASLPPGNARAPVTAFDLSLDVQYKATNAQSNALPNARYQWLAPGWVRADTGRGNAHLRGPRGSFLIRGVGTDLEQVIPLDVGRENIEDRRALDEEAGLAGNFASLTDPQSVRVRKLSELSGMPGWVPSDLAYQARTDAGKTVKTNLVDAAKRLAWLEIESPDFYVSRTGTTPARMARVALGVDAITRRVELAIVDDAAARANPSSGAAVLRLTDYKTVDGFAVPYRIEVWLPEVVDPDAPPRAIAMRPLPAMDVFVRQASLRAPLQATDFLPPAPKTPK